MKRYELIDSNDEIFLINEETFKLLTDNFTIQVDIIEKSYKSGADFPGIQRDESKEFSYIYDINSNNEQTFRTAINNFTMQLRKCIKIRDIINRIETEVRYSGQSIEYDDGGFFFGAKVIVNFIQLRPFWEDIEYSSESISGTSTELIVENTGYTDTPPIIQILANEQITKFAVKNQSTGAGILIRDLQFGINGLNVYIIDCKDGTAELNQILRNQNIKNETGFFDLQVGQNIIFFDANGSANINILWKRRYYV